MPLWLPLDVNSKYPDGTVFILDCDMCASRFAHCDSDVKSDAPMSELLAEIEMTDWLVLRSSKPGVTVKFLCPGCQAAQPDLSSVALTEVTPERASPMARMKAAGSDLMVGELKSWGEARHGTSKPHGS